MAEYKIYGSGVIRNVDGAAIPNDDRNSHWQAYQEWISQGNTPDPEFTIDELRARANLMIEEKANSLIDSSTSHNPREKRKSLARSIRLLRKELKGTATQGDIDELDINESISNYIDSVGLSASDGISWVNDQARTTKELESFDPAINITWPTPV